MSAWRCAHIGGPSRAIITSSASCRTRSIIAVRVARIVTVIEGCIVAAQTGPSRQINGRVIHHADASASSVLPLPVAVVESSFLAGLVPTTGPPARLLEPLPGALLGAVTANATAFETSQKVTTTRPTRQLPEIRHVRSPSAAQKTCETSACRARGALSRALRST